LKTDSKPNLRLLILLSAGKGQQAPIVLTVRSPQSSDILLPALIHLLQIMASSPINWLKSIELGQDGIRHDPRMAAVAVGKKVNIDKPVMEASRNLQR
jgi:hypothetical protein